jgi:hypothetical protein
MVHYSYKIAGRTHGAINQQLYEGRVEANTPKEAILKALAEQFGDQGQSDPLTALTASDWTDCDVLIEQYEPLGPETANCDLQTGEHSYAIEITEIIQPDDQTMTDWWGGLNDHERCQWAARVAKRLGRSPDSIVTAVEKPWLWRRESYYLAHELDPALVEVHYPDVKSL